MGIVVYNSLTRRKEPLVPLQPGRLGMYVCGVTVYDLCHIGHARVMVVFDVIARHLRASGFQLTYVRNFTDIDDKIIRRAGELGVPIDELTERYIAAFHRDMTALGVAPADVEPRATDHIQEMITLIQQLMARGIAYASGGDIFYAVDRFATYGRLSGKDPNDLEAGARVAVDERKANPLDFVLWKGAKPGEPQWASPWGPGRPGWHIECSAMSCRYLGEAFDIHGGGRDLIFPHHENEIAQTEGATGHPWVRYWLHNGFVNVVSADGEREKMSKSLGNFHTIADLLQSYRGEVLRLFILNSHYRSQLDFSFDLLNAAQAGLDRLYAALEGAIHLASLPLPPASPMAMTDPATGPFAAEIERFRHAMEDDFNTSQALAVLFDLAKGVNLAVTAQDASAAMEGARVMRGLGAILGLLESTPAAHRCFISAEAAEEGLTTATIEARIAERLQARQQKDFKAADQIRQDLADQGITLMDSKDGTTWQRSR